MKKKILLITYLLITQWATAQVLFSEDFNTYPAGHLNTDYTGTTVGQGGWVTKRHANASATAMVTPETGKGNVVTFTTNTTSSYEYIIIQQAIDALWNNRTAGNNVLKFEYEVYGVGFFNAEGSILNNTVHFITLCFKSTSAYQIEARTSASVVANQILKSYTSSTFPYNTWHKVEMFYDYNAKRVYYYVPNLNLFKVDNIISTNLPENINLSADSFKSGTIVKYDNIKLTALPSVPPYILSANEIVSSKFSMYPNPATNVVNISNSENMLVEQVTVYDITGKQLSTQTFNNQTQTQIQLNVENLASGTYMLHIQTNAGLAVKKMVKK